METGERGWEDEELKQQEGDYLPNADLSVWLRSCHSEVSQPLQGNLTYGKIPIWLTGCLVRNGPGGVDVYGQGSCKHLFDAPGLLQKFSIKNGTVTYSSKFIRTGAFKQNMAAQRLVLNEFGTVGTPDPCQTIFARIAAVFLGPLESALTDTANISIYPFGDEIYSLAETPFAHRIDLDTLNTTKTINVNDKIGIINHSAHPHIQGKKLYNMGQKLSLWLGPHYVIAELQAIKSHKSSKSKPNPDLAKTPIPNQPQIDPAKGSPLKLGHGGTPQDTNDELSLGESTRDNFLDSQIPENVSSGKGKFPDKERSPWSQARIVATIPSRWPFSLCYMHTFSLTPNYFIIIEQPLCIFLPTVPLSHIYGDKTIASCLKFYPEEDTIFHVVGRQASAKKGKKGRRSFHTSSFFFLHTINAYEMYDGDTGESSIVVDICCYKDPHMIDCMYVDALKNAHSDPDYAKMFRGRPKRFLIKLDTLMNKEDPFAGVESEMIVDIGCETPRINEFFDGKPYNYFYAISSDVDLKNPGTLIKVDVLKKTYETWCEPDAYPSEPIFIPRPESQREDDGIVLSSIVYGRESVSGPNRTSLIILNATSWDPISKIDFNVESAVPKCLHGFFFPDKSEMTSSYAKPRSLSRQHSKV